MFGLFERPSFTDPQLGELRRSGGMWRGTVSLDEAAIPLVVSGSRSSPDPDAIEVARGIGVGYPLWRAAISRALSEHYLPYAEAVTAGDADTPVDIPRIDAAEQVWLHAHVEYVQVAPLDGTLTVEIGYRVVWDDEHTLGARLRDGQLMELCGSVLAP